MAHFESEPTLAHRIESMELSSYQTTVKLEGFIFNNERSMGPSGPFHYVDITTSH